KNTGGSIQSKGTYQLFNLAEDPFESTNLTSSSPEKLGSMMKGLIAQLEAHEASYPIDDEGKELRPKMP
ncbi:MAG: N-acetylgalactosamine-6-sulfatase, partial [Verrucomicrobiales bacterium]|nr:N-acetylgalactosamine-6-sulfatase [Verrucomicrobiales bacterium]